MMRKEAFIFIMWGVAFWAFALPVLFWKMGKMDVLINMLDWFTGLLFVVGPYFLIASFLFIGATCFFTAISILKIEKEINNEQS